MPLNLSMAHPSDFPEPSTEELKICVGCGSAVETKGISDTLVAIRTGWRLTRGADVDGHIVLEWRCPGCWAKYKVKAPPSARRPRT